MNGAEEWRGSQKMALLRNIVERKDSDAKLCTGGLRSPGCLVHIKQCNKVQKKERVVQVFQDFTVLIDCYIPFNLSYSLSAFPKSMADVETKLELMRKIVEQKDSDAKNLDDSTLKRFLRARDLDVDKAANFLLKHLSWRREAIPKGYISESEIQNEISQRKIFCQGFDKKGRPIAVVFGCRHNGSNRDLNEFKRFDVYVIEKLCSRMQGDQEKFVIIADLQDLGYSNCDIRGYLAALDILQNNYPERLGKCLLLHAPYLFMQAWKIIYPFIDKNTRSKIIFIEDKNMMTTLLEDIDQSQLPEQYGGRLKLIPIEES